MAFVANTGIDLAKALAKALGLESGTWTRIVIVSDCDDVSRVYVKGIIDNGQAAGIVQAVADVIVHEDGEVTAIPYTIGG